MKMRYPFDSKSAMDFNKRIFETLLFGCYSESTRLCRMYYNNAVEECKKTGSYKHILYHPGPEYKEELIEYTDYTLIPKTIGAYPSMTWNGGSPIYNGKFCWQLSGLTESDLSGMWDWNTLRDHIQTYGMRNSLCVALMPTASTSQLLGNNECFEPFTSNIYKRKTLAGEFIVINKYLIRDLHTLNIWNEQIKDYLIHLEGSIQAIEGIPQEIKDLYKTAWEIPQKVLVQQAIDRQPFVDQAQSLNLYVEKLGLKEFSELMFQAWAGKLKTGKYYIHTRPALMPQKFTIDPKRQEEMLTILKKRNKTSNEFMESLRDECDLCSA